MLSALDALCDLILTTNYVTDSIIILLSNEWSSREPEWPGHDCKVAEPGFKHSELHPGQ